MSLDEKAGLMLGAGHSIRDDAVFAMAADDYYGIIDLLGRRGVILQHEKSPRRQKGFQKMVGAVRSAKSQLRREGLRRVRTFGRLLLNQEATKNCSIG
jgi:hypothetical protein